MRKINKNICSAFARSKKTGTLFILSLMLLAILSSIYLQFTWVISMNETSQQAIKSGQIAEAALNGQSLKMLSGVKEDIGTEAYESMKLKLINLVKVEEGIRFAYLYTQRDGKLYFMVDSEPVDSEDYSPAAEELSDTDENEIPFKTGKPFITKPTTDRWGTWVSVLIPMKDRETDKTIAVLGMDYPAQTWNDNATNRLIYASIIVVFMFSLMLTFYIIFKKNIALKKEKNVIELAKEESMKANRRIQQGKENFDNFFNTIDAMIFVLDIQGEVVHVNDTACNRLGYLKEELIGRSFMVVHPEDTKEEAYQAFRDIVSEKRKYCSIPLKTKEGKEIPVETRIAKGKWNGKPVIFCVAKDISELKMSEEKFSKAFHSNAVMMAISAVDSGRYIDVNETFLETLGFERQEVIGKKITELNIFSDLEQRDQLKKEFEQKREVRNVEVNAREKNGTLHSCLFSLDRIDLELTPCWITMMVDITERKQAEERIFYLSYHDQLTGLYNRRFYEEELKRMDIKENLPLTIVMGDVNGLKMINDSFGHAMGDELLKKASQVIAKVGRSDDMIARMGGDEFVILLPKTKASETEKIIQAINDLCQQEKVGSIDVSISFGYETKYNEEENVERIFKKAEDKMYKKKLSKSSSMRETAIRPIMDTLYEKNKNQELHSHRVSQLCESMGIALALPEYEIMKLRMVALLHDIGKIAVDENILNKPGKLTDYEWEEVKRHSEIGYRIISTANDMSDMAGCVLAHHERWDGKGYPKGLKNEEIPYMSRIVAIVDAYDAMTSDRSYRDALSDEVALEELKNNAGTQFDPEMVSQFIEKVLGKGSLS